MPSKTKRGLLNVGFGENAAGLRDAHFSQRPLHYKGLVSNGIKISLVPVQITLSWSKSFADATHIVLRKSRELLDINL